MIYIFAMRALPFLCLGFVLCGCSSDGSVGPGKTDQGGGGPDGGGGHPCGAPGPRPGQRDAHDGVYFDQAKKIVVFGGDSSPFDPRGPRNSVYLDEAWAYDAVCGTWAQFPAAGSAGPGRRGAYSAALDRKRQRMVLFGGRKNDAGFEVLNDTWAFDVQKGAWQKLKPTGNHPAARMSHRVIYDPAADRLLLFGGNADAEMFAGQVLGDTYELSFAAGADGAWRRIDGSAPSARQDPSSALDEKHGLWVLFGGATSFVSYLKDLWAFDLKQNTWARVDIADIAPSSRFGADLRYDARRGRLLLFGGHDAGAIGLRNDTWALALDDTGMSGTFTQLLAGDSKLGIGGVDGKSPERRHKHSMASYADTAWIFGGISDCGPLDDVWTFDLSGDMSWSNVYRAQTGETCARRAKAGQTCPTDCGSPL